MASIDIQDYRGDFEDVADLARRVWVPEYAGQTWVPIPDAEFLRWRLAPAENWTTNRARVEVTESSTALGARGPNAEALALGRAVAA